MKVKWSQGSGLSLLPACSNRSSQTSASMPATAQNSSTQNRGEAGHAVGNLKLGDFPHAGDPWTISELKGLRHAEIRHICPWQASAHSQMKDRCRLALTSLSFITAMSLRAQLQTAYERHWPQALLLSGTAAL